MERWTPDVEATRALGRALGRAAPAGAVVAMVGGLGSGKTALAQGLGEGLDVAGPVVSPTFAVVQLHEDGRLPFVHADLYRVESAADLVQTGLDDLLDLGGVAAIEWADLHPDVLPADHLRVEIEHADTGRRVRLHATGPRHAAWLEAVDG